jgi:CBS domain-containing protein
MLRRTLSMIRPGDPVEAIMHSPVATVAEDASLREVVESLAGNGIGALAVVRHDRVLGIVSERDVVGHLATGADLEAATAADLMSTELLTVHPQEPIVRAAQRVSAAEVRHLPVLDHSGRLQGFLSVRDLLVVLLSAVAER